MLSNNLEKSVKQKGDENARLRENLINLNSTIASLQAENETLNMSLNEKLFLNNLNASKEMQI